MRLDQPILTQHAKNCLISIFRWFRYDANLNTLPLFQVQGAEGAQYTVFVNCRNDLGHMQSPGTIMPIVYHASAYLF